MDDPLVSATEKYLAGLNSTLWGRAWDMSSDDERYQAALWFADQYRAVGHDATTTRRG